MNDLKIFSNDAFGSIRTIDIDGKTYFVGKDIAKALGYDEPHKAVIRHCRYGMKHPIPLEQGGTKPMNVIPEGDVYRLIIKSQLPSAEKFEHWVFDEVLPTLRETGSYMIVEDNEHPYEAVSTDNRYLEAARLIASCRLEKALPYLIATLKNVVDFSDVETTETKLIGAINSNDPIDLFLTGKNESDIINHQSKDVYNQFKIFCIQKGYSELNLANFSRAIHNKLGLLVKRKRVNGQLTGFFVKG